ncbi:DUF6443 domain-containing protein [Tenacibaculum singaporense]|uniref:DUF6443 domain-containing protein n=1 Tax=Tenacibaculum singaporense TaxID=2358479 RepID=UPI000F6801F5|nr:DUF6443 domain-containing protein [Tenacibaculum singaporense]RSC92196.1 RHS repeat-associated core domain-containing protein [Tenacibaculum singaporense]
MKKLLYMLLVMLPMTLSAQTTSENYVVTKVYKKETTTPINEIDKDQVKTTIQYFDGLGRAKQSIAIQAGGVLANANEMPIDWASGNTGSTDFYNRNGTEAESRIISGTTPFGNSDLLWECIPDAASGADGGWNTDYFEIDNTKTYRYTVWVKKNKVGSGTGRTYHGTRNVNNLSGTANGNPYFLSPYLPQANTWYLMVGVIHPYNYTGGDSGLSGLYDKNGTKIQDGTEYIWRSDLTTTSLRNYLYYCTDTSVRQYFWSPLFQQIDGGETSFNELVNSEKVLTSQALPKDIVTHFEYDEFGRQTKEYLPYATVSNGGAIITGDVATATNAYYQAKHQQDFAGVNLPEVNAYSEKILENSPLNRVFEQAAPGKDWKKGSTYSSKGYTNNSHSIKFEYDANSSGEVKIYGVTTIFADNTYSPTLTGGTNNYPVGELSKTVTKDENWTTSDGNNHTTEEFKNKQRQVVLKRTYALVSGVETAHDTYYVYDDFGNLTYVLPPKSEAQTDKPTTIELNELCYQYVYDHRNRLVEKKIPGKGWEYIVYDKLDRPVLTQDAMMRRANSNSSMDKWLFTKYDALGKVVYTGYIDNNSIRTALQNAANSTNYTQFEKVTSKQTYGGADIYYTKTAVPNGVTQVYTINYYDTYIDLPTGLGQTVTTSYGVTSTTQTKGLATVNKTRVLNTNNWITTVTYYDAKARPIYVYSKNDELGTIDIVETKLDDFTGKVLQTKATHTKGTNTPIVTVDRFEYDHMDRLVSQTQQINNQISKRIVKNRYDELGQLEAKLIGNGTRDGYKDVTSGISISNDIITKTGGSGWAEGFATLGSIQADGYVEFTPTQLNKYYMAGLSATNTNAHYNTIKYAIYIRDTYKVHIYEQGSSKGQKTTYKEGDVFRVERIGSEIHYKKNGETFYISQTPSSGTLLGDISMYHTGAQIKDIKIVDNSKGLQKVDYAYNVRGWLKNINADGKNDNDLFNFTINYNKPQNGATPLFNGNISETSWSTLNTDTSTRSYSYEFDALNRLVSATGNIDRYNLSSVTYDKNGNIKTLVRKGHLNVGATSFGTMDDLTYTYDSGNKLLKIADSAPIDQFGFKDDALNTTADTANDYTYDANGNMLTDTNKGITSNITYNHLNLPVQINVGGQLIKYTYDASGAKLKKVSNGVTTEYAGNYRYVGGALKDFKHTEGYVKKDGSSFNYVYSYTDHLGNVRLNYADLNNDGVIQAATEILDEKNYYPFGGTHEGYNTAINGAYYPFGYNSKEENDENGLATLDFGARNYDKWAGRWMNLDPLAEKYYNLSGYNFTANNPILYVDPNGKEIIISGNTKTAMTQLAQIAATKQGRLRLNALKGDVHTYRMKGVFFTGSADYDAQGLKGSARTIYYPTSSWRISSEGGAPEAMYLTGHEIQHAYDHYNNRYDKSTSGLERAGVGFGNYLRSVYGEKDMRTSYRSERFSDNPKSYNSFNEKVSDFKETLNFETTKGDTVLGFSYSTSTGKKGKTKTEYLISYTTKDGVYAYRRFTDKKEYNAAIERLNKIRKNKEGDEK